MFAKKYTSIFLVLVMLVTMFATTPVFAVSTEGPGNVFRDDFNDGNADGWIAYGGGDSNNRGVWSVNAQKQYVINGNTGAKTIASGTNFKDLVYEADIQLSGYNQDNSGLIFRVTNPADNQNDGYNGYYACLRWDKKMELGKVTSSWKSLKVVDIPVTSGHMKVVAVGNNIKVYLNDMNTPKIDYTDTDTDAITTAGAVGLRTYWGTTAFDNVEARDYLATETAAPSFNTPEGVYNAPQTISLSAASDAVIHYTTDGTLPTSASPVYSGPINVTHTTIIKAYAEKAEEMVSEVATGVYIIGDTGNVFNDDFEDGTADGWQTYVGQNTNAAWTVSGGKYTLTNSSGDKAIAANTSYDNFILDADVNPGNNSSSTGVVFRASNAGAGCDNLNGYFVGINVNGFIEIGKQNSSSGGQWTLISKTAAIVNASQDNHIRIYANGSDFYIFLNGKLSANFTDATYTEGSIGVRGWNSNGAVTFDNINVRSLSEVANTFSDDFSDGTYSKWTTYGGMWNVSSDNWLNVTSGQGYKAIANNTDLSDVSYEADLKITSGTGDAGMLFRVTGATLGGDNVVGYYAGINAGSQSVILGKMNNNWNQLTSASKAIAVNTTYHMKVLAFGSSIKVFIDDMTTPIITFVDSSYTHGAIGIRIYNSAASFDNISAKTYSAAAEIESFKLAQVTTKAGTPPKMPSQITAVYNDGTSKDVDVTWDTITSDKYQNPGSFIVEGYVAGYTIKAKANVTVSALPLAAGNAAPVANQAPLVKTPFIPLPLGSVKAEGWLLKQLQLQKDGATGHAEELYSELGSDSAWLGGNAANSDWERPPYYVKGLVALAYTLGDTDLQDKAGKWIEWALESQKPDGSFGPSTNNDWWPRMPMLYAMRDYYEATGDERIITFMTNYFNYEAANLPSRPLTEWAKARVGDNIDSVLWLYNRTKDASLLTLADTLKSQGYDNTDIFTNNNFYGFGSDFYPNHNVNVSEDIKMPAIYYQRSGSEADKNAFMAGDNNLIKYHGQITGMSSGTEFLAGLGSTQGAELCAIVERMQSDEEAQMILGAPYLGDQLEKIAFNALPGALSKDFKEHQYYSLPNQVQSINAARNHRQDYANGLEPSVDSGFPCCRFNMHMGWPYYVKNMWAATDDGGIAAMAYGPSNVTTKINDQKVTITEDTNYPFEEQIKFTVNTDAANSFPLKLRIPEWCKNAVVQVNGQDQTGVTAGQYYTITRTWSDGDIITLSLPMEIQASTQVSNSVGIERGPLVYSLKIGENWTKTSERVPGYGEYTVLPTTPWNYGLVVDKSNPEASFKVNKSTTMPDNPFVQSTTPVTLTAAAKRIPAWGLGPNGVDADEVPLGPVASSKPQENITLIPYGAENLRVTYFPQIQTSGMPASKKYEAEDAVITDAMVKNTSNDYSTSVSNGQYVGSIDNADSTVQFNNVYAGETGTYTLEIAYASGSAGYATHNMTVNGAAVQVIKYAPLDGWGRFGRTYVDVSLNKGSNTIKFAKGDNYAELDYIAVLNGEDTAANPVTQITVSGEGNADTITTSGGTLQMTAAVLPEDASNKAVDWSVQNITGKAVIDPSTGILTAISNGTVTVTAAAKDGSGVTGSLQITISGQQAVETPDFSDDFNTKNADGWTTYGGTWSASSGAYAVNAGGGNKAVANGTDFANFTYEADVTINGGNTNDNAGLIFRVNNPTVGADSLQGYYAGIRNGGTVQVGRFNNGWTELASIPYPIQSNTVYHLKVDAKGSNIDVYVNGTHVVSVVDDMWTHGAIGMRTWYVNVSYDNIAVKDTGAYENPAYDWSKVKGAVFVPTNAVNEIQEWKFYDHDTNDRELSYAHDYGINSIRVFLHYLNWKYDKENFMNNVEDFLKLADKYNIKTELVFFDDCWDAHPNWDAETADLTPIYGAHNSRWRQCPGSDVKSQYNNADGLIKADLKAYVQDIVNAHKDDSRILFWDIYNEPGNGQSSDMAQVTVQIMNDARMWIKDTGSAIPVSATAGTFLGGPFSDFITWHSYDSTYPNPYPTRDPKTILVDECMNRSVQTVPGIVDHYGSIGMGYVMWEFGIGRDNCRFPWGSDTNPLTSEVTMPFHGIVYPDGHPWDVNDIKALMGSDYDKLPVYHVQYFKDNNFTDLAKSSITPRIDFDLGDEKGTGSPDASAGIDKDNFSIRWMGTIKPEVSGEYTFYADCDNIARIWVNDTKVVDKTSNIREEASGKITLNAGQMYPVKVEYVHATGASSLHVKWSVPNGDKQVLLPIYANKTVDSVTLNTSTLNLAVDATASLVASINPADAVNQNVTWSSDHPEIASVDSNGVVTGEGAGSAVITVTTADGAKTAACSVTVAPGAVPAIPASASVDQFDSTTLDSAWTVANALDGSWSLTQKPGSLRIYNEGGDMWQTQNGQKNVFLKNAPSGDFEIITKVSSAVAKNYQQSGLILWQDQDNYIRLGRVFDSGNGGRTLEFAKEVNAVYSGSARINPSAYPTGERVYMKVTKIDNVYTAYFWNGTEWVQAANPITADLSNIKVGLYSLASTDGSSVNADFDYFAINELTNKQVTGISIKNNTMDISVGETAVINAVITPDYAVNKGITWTSSNPDIAAVNTEGVITGLSQGNAAITAATAEGGFTATCEVTVGDDNSFSNPIVPAGGGGGSADPWVTFKDGYYYYSKVDSDSSIQVAKAKRLQDIGTVPRVKVYTPSNGQPSEELWAPEIHYLDGKWYIYYTAGAGANHRMYVLESNSQDAQGTYTWKGKISDSTDKWAIDGTVLEKDDGSKYFVWSGWEGDVNVKQNIYIAPMSNPYTISGDRVLISTPEKSWELNGTPLINEGPEILKKNGKIFVVYSASGSWTDEYCLGMLTNTDGDVMNPASWTKSDEPVFKKADTAYGPGHASFTKSPDGSEDWIVYHADKNSGGGWANRSVRAQKFTWNADGTPNFGTPLPYGTYVTSPSGTQEVNKYKYEAENAVISGIAYADTSVNGSGGMRVGHINNPGTDSVLFNVNVAQAGTYRLTVMGDNGTDGGVTAEQDVFVNGGEAQTISYENHGWDNWNPSDINVQLNAGSNAIKITAKTNYAEIDCIILEKLSDDTPVVKDTDATLSDLRAGGKTVDGFSSDITNYNVELPAGTTTAPEVTAAVTDTGKATAVVIQAESTTGSATVVVTAEDGTTTNTYTVNFTVAGSGGDNTPVLNAVTLTASKISLGLNDTAALTLSGTMTDGAPADFSNAAIEFFNDNPEVTTMSATTVTTGAATAVVIPLKEGTSNITASVNIGGVTKTSTVSITVAASQPTEPAKLSSVTLTVDSTNLEKTKTAKASVTGKMNDGTNADLSKAGVIYYSEDSSIASIDSSTGVITANKAGNTTVYAVATLDGVTLTSNKVTIAVQAGQSTGTGSDHEGRGGSSTASSPSVVNVKNTDTASVVSSINAASSNAVISLDVSENKQIGKEIFDAIKGTNKTVVFEAAGIQWTFNGKDITGATKAIDTAVSIATLSSSTSSNKAAIAGELNSGNALVISFANNGQLPGKAAIKLKLDAQLLANLDKNNINVYYYNEATKTMETVASGLKVDGDGYLQFNITHNSDYVITDKALGSAEFVRLSGSDRYETCIKISQSGWKTSNYAVLATGEDFPDALSAAPLARKYNAPILITKHEALNLSVEKEIERLGVKNIFIIGGTGAVAHGIEDKLTSKGIKCTRIKGSDRYETSAAIADYIGASKEVAVATGTNFPDALSIASYAALKGMPILLTKSDSLPDSVSKYIAKSGVMRSYVVGGTSAINDSVLNALPGAERLSGDNRYATNTAILKKFSSEFDLSKVYFATGENFPDALTGSALAASVKAPIVLVNSNITDGTSKFIKENISRIKTGYALGGSALVTDSVKDILIK